MTEIFSEIFLKIKNKLAKDKHITQGASKSFIINLVGVIIGYLFVILVSRIYKSSTAEIYGQYVLITIVVRIASIVARFGTDTTILKLTAAFSSKNLWGNIVQTDKKLLTLLISIGIAVTVVVAVLNKQLGKLLKLPSNMVLVSAIFIIPMALGLYYSQSLRGLKKIGISTFLRSSAVPILNFVLLPVFLLFVNKNSAGFTSLPLYSFYISIVVTAVIGFIYWNRAITTVDKKERLYDNDHFNTAKQLLKMSYPLLLTESVIFLGTWVDQFMLGIMGSNQDVGIYNICMKYSMVAVLSLQAFNTISAPQFSESFFKNDHEGLKYNLQKSTKMIFWTTIPIVTIYLIFPRFLLGIFGSSFAPGWMAFIILSIGCLLNVMTGSVGVLLLMTGHQTMMQNIIFGSLIFEIILNAILIPIYGVTGAAIASTVCSFIKNWGMAIFAKRHFKFSSIYLIGFK